MLNFIIGTKGSGKTACAHKILGEAVKRGEKAMLVVPKQFTFQSDKRILELLGPKDASEIEVLSFSRLASLVMQSYGGITLPVAKQGARSILMSLAIENLSDKLSVFSKHKNEIALVDKMLCTLDELKKEGISISEFEHGAEIIEDNLLKEKVRETALILRSYDAVISENYFDDADLLSFVADSLKGKDFFLNKTVVLDGFASFTKPERDIIITMLKTAKEVYIVLCGNDLSDSDDLSPFALCNSTARRLKLDAGNAGVSTGKTILCQRDAGNYSAELFLLEKEFFRPVPQLFDGKTENLSLVCSGNISSECDYVARKIKRILRDGKYRCRDIAVCYRNGENYEGHLRRALKKYGVPLFEDKRQAVENQPLISFVSSLMLICARGLSSDYIFRLLKTGLASLDTDEISELENYCFVWDITGKKWLAPWTENPDGLGEKLTEERKLRLEKLNLCREAVVLPVEQLRKAIKDATGKQAITLIYSFLRENGVDQRLKQYAIELEERGLTELALEQEQVWDLLMEAFDEIAGVLNERTVSCERLYEIFNLVLKTKSLGKLPDGFDEVLLCSADRMLTNNASVLFVMGLNSGVFPAQITESGLFSQRERSKLKNVGLDFGEDIKQTTLRERYLLFNALTAATRELHLSYSVSVAGGEKPGKSEAVELVQKIFPLLKTFFDSDESELQFVESEEAAFELMAKSWNENTEFTATLKEYFSTKKEYRTRFEAVKRATEKGDFAFENKENALKLFGKDMYFSASKLETYGICPFRFFCRYGLDAKPRIKAQLDASHSGTVIHHVLELLLKKYRGKDFLELSDEKLKQEVSEILKAYMDENMGSDENKSERFNYLYYRTGKILDFILMRLKAEFSNSDFVPCDFELKIGKGSEVEPMVFELEEGTAQLSGYVDRVDSLDLNGKRYIRIVDYKSGEKKFKLSDVLSGMNMQMLLYLVSIWRNGKGYYENITPSGVLYFPARISPLASERNLSDEKRLQNRIANSQMSGMLVDDGEAVRHMEKELKGMFIPVKLDEKTQTLKGDFISVKHLFALGERMDKIICEMGNSLHNGLVPAKPVCGSAYTDVCAWCDYGDVCMQEEPEFRYIIKRSHDDCVRELSGGEENGSKLD